VRAILIRHRLPPAPQRDGASWRQFLRQHSATMLACDFFTVETVWLTRIFVLFFVSLECRRVEFVASTRNRTAAGPLGASLCAHSRSMRQAGVSAAADAQHTLAPTKCKLCVRLLR
jgi:hypothetical protein